jgi:anti-anti-sigma factor
VASYELEQMVPDESGPAYIAVSGELDLTNADDLAERLGELANGDRPLVLDLSRVVFIDSAAIHRLFRIARDRSPGTLAFVVEPTAPVAATLEIVGFGQVATVAASLAEARANLI